MIKKAAALASVLTGCSMQANAPTMVQPAQAQFTAQPAPVSQQPEDYALINCDYRLKMDTWGYSIECNQQFVNIRLDHYEWAPESAVYDGKCDERLFFEMGEGRTKYIDYGCDGHLDALISWVRVQREGYDFFAPDTMAAPAEEYNGGFDFLKTAIGAEQADARWRFRYNVPARGGL